MPSGVTEKYLLDEIWFYAVLTDGVGRFRLSVELRDMDDIISRRSEPQRLVFAGGDQLNVKEVRVHMTSVPFARPGLYEFRLIANHAHLEEGGTAFLRVLPG